MNLSKAINHLKKSSKMDNPFAICSLGFYYHTGNGVKQNMKKSLTLYRHAAELNNPRALCNIGVCYARGEGIEPDLIKAVEYFKQSSEFNNPFALFNLGVCYENGEGVEKDLPNAVKYYKRAAELNHPSALYNLGVCYDNGKGVQQNSIKAVKFYEKAAEFDHINSIFNLATCFICGDGINQDYKKAVELYHRIIELTDDSKTYFRLFYHYSSGIGIERNILQSIQFLIKSATLSYQESFVHIGLLLLNGTFITKNEEGAASYFRKSSEKYNSEGLFWYGVCLIEGKGIPKNFYVGRDFIECSCEKKFFLSELYYSSIEAMKHHYT
jgi:TPR repeat protein